MGPISCMTTFRLSRCSRADIARTVESSPATNGVARKHVDDLFRAGMVKLNMSTSYLKPIPSGKPHPIRVLCNSRADIVFSCTQILR